jgi:NitT/TauT family transport system substrate-binding protein
VRRLGSIAAAVALASCTTRDAPGPLRVGTWKTQQTIQPFLYERFAPSRTVQVSSFTNPGDMKAALLAGSLDAAGTTIVHAIVSASKGEPVVLVASMCQKASALVVGARSGVESPAGLRGKRIGYVPSTMHHVLLLEVLRRAGLSPDDVSLVRVDFFDMVNALSRRQIDAFLSGEPYPTLAVRGGAGRILAYPYLDDGTGPLNAGVLVKRDTVARHPERVREIVRAHAEATRFLVANEDEWIRRAAALGNDPAVLRDAARNIELSWDMDPTFVARVRRLGEEMLRLRMIDRLPDWDALLDTRFVDEVRARP